MIDGVKSGLDKLVYTKEEKAEDAAKAVTEARSYLIQWMDKTQGQNLARRFLAMVITLTWLSMFFLSTALDLSVVWVEDSLTNENLRGSSVLIGARAESMTGAMMLILGFYFAAPHLDKIVGGAMERFGGSKS
jgi:hypothetical protein